MAYNTFKIMQIKNMRDCDYAFMSYHFAKKHNFSLNDYEVVYEFDTLADYDLDDIYEMFNIHHPEDFRGHSLSVSDIIVKNNEMFYVDSFGFAEIEK